MKESRVLSVHDKVVGLKDLQRLAEILVSLSPPRTSEAKWQPDVSFVARCDDNSTFESANIDIFADSSPVTTKRVLSVKMDYFCCETKSSVVIELWHGSSDNINTISVRGPDSTWVNGTLRRLQEALEAFTPQANLVRTFTPILRPIFAFSFGLIIVKVLVVFMQPSPDPNWGEIVYARVCAKYALLYFFGLFPAAALHLHLLSYWPSVEFQVGPPHMHFERKRRLWLANAFLLGVFPFLTSLVYDIVKAVLAK